MVLYSLPRKLVLWIIRLLSSFSRIKRIPRDKGPCGSPRIPTPRHHTAVCVAKKNFTLLLPYKQTQIEVSFERTRHQTRTSATCSTGNSLIERGIWFSALIRALGSCKLTNVDTSRAAFVLGRSIFFRFRWLRWKISPDPTAWFVWDFFFCRDC